MSWLSSNWIWILLAAFVAFHLFGHRHHRHGYAHGYDGDDRRDGRQPASAGEGQKAALPASGSAHDHADADTAGSEPNAQRTDDHPRHRHGC